ncbi:MAG TPA: hypothetical protein PL067_09985 [Bacteroidales bacterium]|nr:hypothetical protein [Bacteroidales bacterium]HPO41041.1 hypothetical protein [Bacteroidales bacterium]
MQTKGELMMTDTKEHSNCYPDFGHCDTMMKHGRRSCGIGFGVMFTLIGAIWLAAEMGWIVPDLFWPVAFLAAGLTILALNFAKGGKPRNEKRPDKEV